MGQKSMFSVKRRRSSCGNTVRVEESPEPDPTSKILAKREHEEKQIQLEVSGESIKTRPAVLCFQIHTNTICTFRYRQS